MRSGGTSSNRRLWLSLNKVSSGRARERSETDGFIKILVDADTELILGAAILGINGDEVVHSFGPRLGNGTSIETWLRYFS